IADISDAPESDRGEADAKLQALIARFIVRDEAEFTPSVVELLIDADAQAQRLASPGTEATVCEGDLLRAVLESGAWAEIRQDDAGHLEKKLPEESAARRVLGEIEREGQVDRNGYVQLTGLSAPALQIIEIAHHLAEQRGASQITNRLLLAAFLIEDHGHPAELCRRAGVDPTKICAAMIALTPAGPSQAFPLSLETCERILLPTMNAARKMAAKGAQATERDLFKAFCQQADPAFTTMLQDPLLGLDLDKLAAMGSTPPRAER